MTTLGLQLRKRRLGLPLLLVFLLVLSWSLSAGPSSGPDPAFNLASVWCARGLEENRCEEGSSTLSRQVPKELLNQCPLVGLIATCSPMVTTPDLDAPRMQETSMVNVAGNYVNGYFWISSFLITDSLTPSLIAMRSLNALVFLSIVFLVLFVARDQIRRSFAIAFACAAPSFFSLVVPISNQSWAVAGLVGFWVFVLHLGQGVVSSRAERLAASLGILLSIALSALSRTDAIGLLVAQAAICSALLLSVHGFSTKFIVGAFSAIGLFGILVLRFFVAPAFFTFFTEVFQGKSGALSKYDFSFSELLFHNFQHAIEFVGQSLAGVHETAGDPSSTGPTIYLVLAVLGGLAVFLSGKITRSFLLVVGLVAMVIVVYPVLATVRNGQIFTEEFVPRYLTPFAVAAVGLMIVSSPGAANLKTLSVSNRRLLISLLAIAHASALHTALRASISGGNLGISTWNLNEWVLWWWPVGPSPMTIWLIGSLSLPAFLSLELRRPIDA